MAKYNTRYDERTNLTIIEITGSITLEEQLSFMNGKSYAERTMRMVTDMRNASLEKMPRGMLVKMVRTVQPLSKPGLRSAYVLSGGDDFDKAKNLLAQLDVLNYDGNYRIFTDIKKAMS